MYLKVTDHKLLLSGSNADCQLDISQFITVTSIRISPNEKRLAICAIPHGAKTPNPLSSANEKGDVFLYYCDIEDGAWVQLTKKYAEDPVWTNDDQLLYYNGNGIDRVTISTIAIETLGKTGQFSFGSPSLSVNSKSDTLAFVKWKGDSQMLATLNLESKELVIHKHSCYRYAWFDDEHIVFTKNAGLKLLNVKDEKVTTLLGKTDGLKLFDMPSDDSLYEGIRDIFTDDNWMYFSLSARYQKQYRQIFVKVTKDLTKKEVLYSDLANKQIQRLDNEVFLLGYWKQGWFGRKTYETEIIGKADSHITQGYIKLFNSQYPNFGDKWLKFIK